MTLEIKIEKKKTKTKRKKNKTERKNVPGLNEAKEWMNGDSFKLLTIIILLQTI